VKSGIELFEKRLHPAVIADIKAWSQDSELSKLLEKLQSLNDAQHFLNHYAEVMVARHLIKRGCKLEVEVPTVNRRSADFKVSKDDHTFFLHVKRLNVDEETQKEMKIHHRLQNLKKIRKPVMFGIVFFKCLNDREMQEFYKQAKDFIKKGKIGERMTFEDSAGQELAECEISGWNNMERVQLVVAMSVKHADDAKRLYKKLSDAYKQFMPDNTNIILVTGTWKENIVEFEESLLEPNGFWEDDKHSASEMVGWFDFRVEDDYINFRTWCREKCNVPTAIQKLF